MSRSRKKPIVTDNRRPGTKKFFKKHANKVIRKTYIICGNYYKKLYFRWDINEYRAYIFPDDEFYSKAIRK
ncbi:MAG: hypothetical protein ACOC1K_04590 [Nanoarchaeota archaeon]